jgi:ornithine cyclodeaminase/alanine dehydrogenase-like protein (mu-crystallin family)
MEECKILYITGGEIKGLLSWKEIIETCDAVFRWIGKGEIEQYHVSPIRYSGQENSTSFAMPFPALVKPLSVIGNKWGGGSPNNIKAGFPGFTAQIALNDAQTMLPIAIMDGTEVTAMRTGGHAAVGAKYLARKDSETIAVIGCGIEGRSFLAAMDSLFKLKEAKIYDIAKTTAIEYAETMGKKLSLNILPCNSPREAVKNADIICMCTTATEVIVRDEWVEEGCHVAVTKAFTDLDPKFSKTAQKWALGNWKIDSDWFGKPPFSSIPDLSPNDAYADMSEIAIGEKPGREAADERTVMTHMGMGALDVAVGYRVYEAALEKGLGIRLKLF